MKSLVPDEDFIRLAKQFNCEPKALRKALKESYPTYDNRKSRIDSRIRRLRKEGYLPLDSGNKVSLGEVLTGTTTLYAEDGSIKHQYVKTSVPKHEVYEGVMESIRNLVLEQIEPLETIEPTPHSHNDDLLATYISNDLHLGLLVDGNEAAVNWNLDKGLREAKAAIDFLMQTTPTTKECIVVDLGDMVESDDRTNRTRKSGNPLDVDGFYHNIFERTYQLIIYFVQRALEKHEVVHFYNVEGNHDNYVAFAVRHIVKTAFKDNPRVKFSDRQSKLLYHLHGQTLLGFAHGDEIKPAKAETAMVSDNHDIWSETKNRYFHFGHVHSFKSEDKSLCTTESHRHLMPLNSWAYNNGFRGPLGTMKSITYSKTKGEVSRNVYQVSIEDDTTS